METELQTTSTAPIDGLAVETGQDELPQIAELPVLGGAPVERADAARNRLKILEAAERLFNELGTENVSMDAVADAAQVGKGTLYRRFGDRSGLARAILDERTREFQEQIIRGPAPLGPGAAPCERLIAFGDGWMNMLASHGDVVLAAESGAPGARFHGPVYASFRLHIRQLLQDLDADLDLEYFADVLLAALSAEMVNYWRGEIVLQDERLAKGFAQLVELIAGKKRS
jgi:AcrR family transcriptional regulator